MATQLNPRAKVSSKKTALRIAGSDPIGLQIADAGAFGNACTIQAWVRPDTNHRGIAVFSSENFVGTGTTFAAGRYDDLSRLRIDKAAISSLQVPPGFRAVLFTEPGCTGSARTVDCDCPALGTEWDKVAHSLLVFDLKCAKQSHAIVYEQHEFEGMAAVLNVGRYDELTFVPPSRSMCASLWIPAGLEATLYDRPGCQGAARSFQGSVANTGEFVAKGSDEPLAWHDGIRSLALTSAAVDSAAVSPAASGTSRVDVLTTASGDGLWLEMIQPASLVLPPQLQFMGARLHPDRWHHIALTLDGINVCAYLNGRALPSAGEQAPFELSGDWTLGGGFSDDIGLISWHGAALSAQEIKAQRFDVPRDGDPNLAAAWNMERDARPIHLDVDGGEGQDATAAGALWVGAKFPASSLDSAVGRKALSEAKRRGNDAKHQARLQAKAALDKAHKKAEEKKREAHNNAMANAHAARIETLRVICAGDLVTLGPGGSVLDSEGHMPNTLLADIAYDAAAMNLYLSVQSGDSGDYRIVCLKRNESAQADSTLYRRKLPVHALAPGNADGNDLAGVFWIEGDGCLCWAPAAEAKQVVTLASQLASGRDREWSMAFDATNQHLFWSNGREIWRGTPTSDGKLVDINVVVSHGRSPHPIALALDTDSGDLYWLDSALEMLRTCDSSGERIRDLYEALDPREGLALDYFDTAAPDLDPTVREQPTLKLKRLYWNAEYRQLLEVAVIDDPGLFCWLQHFDGQSGSHNNIEALEDTHFSGVAWRGLATQKPLAQKGETFLGFFAGNDDALRALILTRPENDGDSLTVYGWDAATGKREPLLQRGGFNLANDHLAIDADGTQMMYSSGVNSFLHAEGAIIRGHPEHDELVLDTRELHREYGPYEKMTRALAFTADGEQAILGHNTTLSVWELENGFPVRLLEGHSSPVICIQTYAVSNAQYALSGASDGTVKRWDLASGTCLQTLSGHAGGITGLDISNDRKVIVSASVDCTLKVWDLASGACLHNLVGHLDHVTGVMILAEGDRALSWSKDKTLRMWDLGDGSCIRVFVGHSDPIKHAAATDGGRRLFSAGEEMAIEWDTAMERDNSVHEWALQFMHEQDHVDLGPLYLDCTRGFAAEVRIRLATRDGAMTVFSLGNATDGDNLSLTVDGDGRLVFAVEQHGEVTRIETSGDNGLPLGGWHSISLSVDSTGVGKFVVDGKEIALDGNGADAAQRVTVPRACVRLVNVVGRSNRTPYDSLQGEIGALRFWNRALVDDEVKAFHRDPLGEPRTSLRRYHRSVMEYRNGRPYLVSGMSDGSTPAIPMFELALDKGLALQSKSSTAHAKLLKAQHERQVAEALAAARRADERRAYQNRTSTAQAENQKAHHLAQSQLSAASDAASEKRAVAHEQLAAATPRAQERIVAAKDNARQKMAEATQQAQKIKSDAQATASSIKQAANKKLRDAQSEKARQQAKRG